MVHDLEKQLLLRGEVVVERRFGAADALTDITPESMADAPMVKPRKKQRVILFSLLGLAVAAASGGAVEYWKLVGSRYVSTDDAYTAAEVAQVASETEGSVMQVNAVDSQNVKHGDILVMIDDTDAKLALRQAQADLARAQAQVVAAISDVERTGVDLKRREALVTSGSVSGDELTNAKNRASGARAALDAARAQVALARARLDKSDVDLGRTVIRAPIDGVIVRRQVQLGQRGAAHQGARCA
jgi:membrane fusion protein (multidrug efflux system)